LFDMVPGLAFSLCYFIVLPWAEDFAPAHADARVVPKVEGCRWCGGSLPRRCWLCWDSPRLHKPQRSSLLSCDGTMQQDTADTREQVTKWGLVINLAADVRTR